MIRKDEQTMNNITTTSKNKGIVTQTMHICTTTNSDEIWNAIHGMITLEFFVDFGKNFVIEFDNVTLSASDIFRAINTIKKIPIMFRSAIPRIIETSDQIDTIISMLDNTLHNVASTVVMYNYNYLP